MNKESKKLTWAVGLVAGLGVLSIAYAALSSTLNIKGEDATVRIGYVHFQNTSKAIGIGSTNPEYIAADGKNSGGILERSTESGTGMIGEDYFTQNWAKALADVGTVDLSDDVKASKSLDTIVVKKTKLSDFGSFVVYELDIINDSDNDMRLKTIPTVKILKEGTDYSTDEAKDIETKVYYNYDAANFVTPCSGEIAVHDGTKAEAGTYNYLKAGGTTKWYLRVGYKNYNNATDKTTAEKKFSFSTTANWEAVM